MIKKHAALIADKILGPCMANRSNHISEMIKQHFGKSSIYGITSKEEAHKFMEESIKIFFRSITKISKINIRR